MPHLRPVVLLAVTALVVGGVSMASPPAGASPRPEPSGPTGTITESADAVPGEYIVTLADVPRSQVRAIAADLAGDHDGEVTFTYKRALRGFAVDRKSVV